MAGSAVFGEVEDYVVAAALVVELREGRGCNLLVSASGAENVDGGI